MRLALPHGYPPDNSAMKNAGLLLDQKAIDEALVDLLKRMHNLRDMAAHRSGGSGNVATDEAVEFIALAGGVVERFRGLRHAP